MNSRMRLIGTLLALVAAAGCNPDEIGTGTVGDVLVRVFVDADGSGASSTGDVPVAGTVTLTGGDATPQVVTIDANGEAVFADVMPGSYKATINPTIPNGAVLATAAERIVVVPFQGGEVEADFRFVYNPGSVDGTLFRDDNGNGVYDAGVDTPAPGMTVRLLIGTSDANSTVLATTTTNASGQYHFGVIRPGPYAIEVVPIPTIQIVGGNARLITVAAATATLVPVRFTGNLLIPIAQVRTSPVGSTVAFEGTATAAAGLVGTNQLYVQDGTTGILVFGAPTAGIVAGDVVRITGVTTLFSGELEVVAPTGGTLSVLKLSSGTAPTPRAITVAQLLSNAFLGQLIAVSNVKVLSVATTGATSYNVNFQGNSPTETFQVRVGNTNNVPILSTFWEVGRRYDLSGLVGIFNGTIQLKPRASTDVVVGALILGIAQARTHPAGDTVTVEGCVYIGTGVLTQPTAANLTLYMQDNTGGTLVFNVPAGSVYVAGDSLRVRGLVTFFSAEFEIARFTATSPPVLEKIGTCTVIPARLTTGVELASKVFDGQFVRVNNVQVVSVSTPNAAGAYNVVTTAPDATSMTIRIDQSTVGIPSTFWAVGSRYDVSGAALNFSTNGTTFTPQVKPRSPADVVPR